MSSGINQKIVKWLSILIVSLALSPAMAAGRQPVRALYIPLADHYAALVAYERYRQKMQYADFQIQQMKNWDLLRAYFQTGEVEMAFVMSPLAMDMYHVKPHFRWIGLMHRDGNALAINELLNQQVQLPTDRAGRKPDRKVADVLKTFYEKTGRSIEIGLPHLLSTHNVVLYRYLKEHGLRLSMLPNEKAEVLSIDVAPPKSPAFIKSNNNRARAAAFEQSLPWADIVETESYGKVAWYSKDVMPWPEGHVECIVLATDEAINNKQKAINEVMFYIRKAGEDIEKARKLGGVHLMSIVKIIQRHIPAHTSQAIIASLDPELRVINYQKLIIDKDGLKQIMDYAVEGGILKQSIDINQFADTRFE